MKRIFQIFGSLLRNLTWRTAKVFLSRPLFLIPTVIATIESIYLSEKLFTDSPDENGVANAYRHAVWNILIIKYSSLFSSKEKASKWAEKITNLHEEIFPNPSFDRAMDLHNNRIGRNLFRELSQNGIRSKKKMLDYLFKTCEKAIPLTNENEFVNYPDSLVYFRQED